MYCINCGSKIKAGHRFCAVCGASQYPDGYETGSGTGKVLKDNDKAFAIISYLGILSLVSYFVTPKNSVYARFHAVQGLNLFILECIIAAITKILKGIFFWSWQFKSIISGIGGIASVGFIVLIVLGIVYAARGEITVLPVVGSWRIVKE